MRRLLSLLCLLGFVAAQPGVGVAMLLACHPVSHEHEVSFFPVGDGMQVVLDHHHLQAVAAGPVCDDNDEPPHVVHVSAQGERPALRQSLPVKCVSVLDGLTSVEHHAFALVAAQRCQTVHAYAWNQRCRWDPADCLCSTVMMV